MKKNKIGACALALATAAAICVPGMAFAADGDPTATVPADPNVVAPTTDTPTKSELTGTIKATTLSVTVPTAATFNVDPTVNATDPSTQIQSPTNYTITNSSVVPVYAYVSKVEKTDVLLTDSTAGVKAGTTGKDNTIMFGVKDVAPANFAAQGDWFTDSTSKYYAFNSATHGKLAGKTADTTDSATMKFYGQVSNEGWVDGQTFTITPSFTIATTDPDAVSA